MVSAHVHVHVQVHVHVLSSVLVFDVFGTIRYVCATYFSLIFTGYVLNLLIFRVGFLFFFIYFFFCPSLLGFWVYDLVSFLGSRMLAHR